MNDLRLVKYIADVLKKLVIGEKKMSGTFTC